MTDEQRKASDVLLEVEAKLERLNNVVNLYDTNIKLILNKVNAIHSLLTQVGSKVGLENTQPTPGPFRNPNAVDIQAGAPIEAATDFSGQRRVARGPNNELGPKPTTITFKEHSAPKPEPMTNQRKIPIVQRVQRNGKDLFLADVKIFSGNEQIFKGRSNAMGKYQCLLTPGKYLVKVSKIDQTTKKLMEQSQEITVVNSDTILTLPTFNFNA